MSLWGKAKSFVNNSLVGGPLAAGSYVAEEAGKASGIKPLQQIGDVTKDIARVGGDVVANPISGALGGKTTANPLLAPLGVRFSGMGSDFKAAGATQPQPAPSDQLAGFATPATITPVAQAAPSPVRKPGWLSPLTVPNPEGEARPAATPAITPAAAPATTTAATTTTPAATTATPGLTLTPSTDKTAAIKLDSTDPDFATKASAVVMRQEQEKAAADLSLRQQSQRTAFMQQLADSGQRGSTLATLSSLKDRELGATMAGLQWQMANQYADHLATLADTADADNKANFASAYNAAVASNDFDSAARLANTMVQLDPSDKYWQYMADPTNMEAMRNSMKPGALEARENALTAAMQNFSNNNNVEDAAALKSNMSDIISTMKAGYQDSAGLKLLANSMSDTELQNFAAENYPGVDMSAGYPDSLKEQAYLWKQFTTRLKEEQAIQAETAAGEELYKIEGLNPATAGQVQKALGTLVANGDASKVQLAGVTVPADYFTDTENGASSIFFEDWDGNEDFSNRPALYNTLDGLWMRAVQEYGGDINMTRDEFRESAMKSLADSGYNDASAGTLKNGTIDSVWKRMNSSGAISSADTGAGSYSSLVSAARTGDSQSLIGELGSVDMSTSGGVRSVNRLIDSLEASDVGTLSTWTGAPTQNTPWITKPNTSMLVKYPLGEGQGFGLVIVETGAPKWNKADGRWTTSYTLKDPSMITGTEPKTGEVDLGTSAPGGYAPFSSPYIPMS